MINSKLPSLLSLSFLLSIPVLGISSSLWAAEPVKTKPSPFAAEMFSDIPYYKGTDAAGEFHQLDVLVPKGQKDFPVVVLVHGGSWLFGDKSTFGWYTAVGEFLAEQGVGVVLPNYRLSPQVKHPEHVRDVARAVAWTKKNIAQYGGRPDQMILAGHSAGGHLVSLLATDPSYLEAEGLRQDDVKGVISISGLYKIPDVNLGVMVNDDKMRLSLKTGKLTFLPKMNVELNLDMLRPKGFGLNINLNPISMVFGDDPKVRETASPLNHVSKGLPPFLLLVADNDILTLPEMAADFHKALEAAGDEVELLTVKDRTHNSVMFNATKPDDPVAKAMLDFIRKHTAKK
jgi:acetyl esterase/lipase